MGRGLHRRHCFILGTLRGKRPTKKGRRPCLHRGLSGHPRFGGRPAPRCPPAARPLPAYPVPAPSIPPAGLPDPISTNRTEASPVQSELCVSTPPTNQSGLILTNQDSAFAPSAPRGRGALPRSGWTQGPGGASLVSRSPAAGGRSPAGLRARDAWTGAEPSGAWPGRPSAALSGRTDARNPVSFAAPQVGRPLLVRSPRREPPVDERILRIPCGEHARSRSFFVCFTLTWGEGRKRVKKPSCKREHTTQCLFKQRRGKEL